MTREEAIARIKPHEAELRAAGITSLALFGSVARGEARPDSDVDLMCDIEKGKVASLLDFIGLQLRLESILGASVDLAERKMLMPTIARHASRDTVPVF
ncbi:putative nucleotidyltransferase [Sphingobium xenophagum]|uniref:Nucleotidyltransferase n=1 Tax=Sphingobium xenophagum TaxID=121428 RepID=A0ABU1WY02_SPHXE|nr:nucleotidyltransferase family protein [Sphingobium xenophagum]MDR7153811.1 putative nucleotidyltransferase [Sphingobium xenophagum]